MDHMYVSKVIIIFLVLEVISGDFTIYVVAFFIFLGLDIYATLAKRILFIY